MRHAREAQGLSRSEISSRTKITIDQLSNLETGAFTALAPVYAKGFLKSYAQAISLEPGEVLEIIREYKRHVGQSDSNPRQPLTTKYREIDLASEDGVSVGAALAIFLVALVAIALLIVFNPAFHNFAAGYLPFLETVESAPEGEGETSDAAPNPAGAASAPAAIPFNPPPTVAPATIPLNPPAPPAPSGAADLSEASPAAQAGGRLTLRAVRDTWAQVQVDNGSLVHIYFKAGDSRSFQGQRDISVVLGDARAVEAEWNGESLGSLGPEGPLERTFPPARG
jgi:cytoskeletal protein RodZ